MSAFEKPNISYRPLDVESIDIQKEDVPSSDLSQSSVDEAIANKLIDHLGLIKAYNDRIEAIDYLINNAKTLSGNLVYTTEDQSLILSIGTLGGSGNAVDLSLFEKAIDVVIQGYKEMALISLTGVLK